MACLVPHYCFFVFLLVILLFKMAPRHRTEVLSTFSSVPYGKLHVLDEPHLGIRVLLTLSSMLMWINNIC